MPPSPPPLPFWDDNLIIVAEKVCYVRADLSIIRSVTTCADQDASDCTEMFTPEYKQLFLLAMFVIAMYAVLLPGLFFYALYKERDNLKNGRETAPTKALAFLHRPYKPEFW